LDEKDLISKLGARNEDAFRELVDAYKDRVYNTSLGLLRNVEDAEDIAQEVFIEVFNSISKFRGDSSISTWIYRISVTKSLDFIRRKKRKKRFAFVTSLFSEQGKIISEPADFFHPGVEAENRELSSILFKAIEKLPPNQKIAFTLSKLEDLNYKEISEVMGITVSSVESLLFRARGKLKLLLNDYYSNT
jgi:RNA polymerase sigma-70 factor (ECF subfamily)